MAGDRPNDVGPNDVRNDVRPDRVRSDRVRPDEVGPDHAGLDHVRQMIRSCIQCGTCSASCPNEWAMDHTPRQLWRLVMLDRQEELFASRTFSLCSACYTCTLRCPRGLAVTEAMAALKQIATQRKTAGYRRGALFYQSFLQSVRAHGRVREMELMTLYLGRLKDPFEPFRFLPLGFKLMRKGKIGPHASAGGNGEMTALFAKVEALEAGEPWTESGQKAAQGRR